MSSDLAKITRFWEEQLPSDKKFDRIARLCHLFEHSDASFWCYFAVSSSINAEYYAKFAENSFGQLQNTQIS